MTKNAAEDQDAAEAQVASEAKPVSVKAASPNAASPKAADVKTAASVKAASVKAASVKAASVKAASVKAASVKAASVKAASVKATFEARVAADAKAADDVKAAADVKAASVKAASETKVAAKAKVAADAEAADDVKVNIPAFDGYNKCMESFKSIKWNIDVHRKYSPGAGKGIFCLRPVVKTTCVALYFGHLVDDKGVVVVSCPFTESLFARLPIVKRPYSRGHGVSVNSVACPHVLIVDGEFVYAAKIL